MNILTMPVNNKCIDNPNQKSGSHCNTRLQLQPGRFFLLLIILSIICPIVSLAQFGSIDGQVNDEKTGEPLQFVRVVIPGTNQPTLSDMHGRYFINRVPVGDHTLLFQAIGYTNFEVLVSVQSDDNFVQDVLLSNEFIDGDRIFVTKYQQEQARALARQYHSINFKSVVTSEQLDRFGDQTVEDVMIRLPGVQVGRQGELNLRGTGWNRYYVTIDGQRVPTSGLGDRSVDLGTVSADMIRGLEILRVITPDIDADAMGGVIQINTKRKVGQNRELTARLGGGANTRYFNHAGTAGRASLHYSESLREDFDLAADLSYQLDYRPWETLGIGYGIANFGGVPVDIIERISPSLSTDNRNRIGGGIQLAFRPTKRSSFNVRALGLQYDRDLAHHNAMMSPGGEWIDQNTAGTQGVFGFDVNYKESGIRNYMLQGIGQHLLDLFNIEYALEWGNTRSDLNDHRFSFLRENLQYSIINNDRNRPDMEITNLPLGSKFGDIDDRTIVFETVDRIIDSHVDNTYSGRLDFDVPVGTVLFKAGSSFRLTNKVGDYSESEYTYLRRLTLDRFRKIRNGEFDVFNRYHIPKIVDPEQALVFFNGNYPVFRLDEFGHHQATHIKNYNAREFIYAAYAMATVNLNKLTFMGGVRLEQTDTNYESRRAFINQLGNWGGATDTSKTGSYNQLFPNAQIGYKPGDRTNIRLAYSRSIARAPFEWLVPFELRNANTSTLFRGNPELDPMISDNLDLLFEHYLSNTGILSVGLFQKQLSGFIYLRERNLSGGDYDGWLERKYFNGDEKATIYGVEVSWKQRLIFLPGFLRHFGTYANYTWSKSDFKVDYRNDDVTLPVQSPHVVNAALYYDQGRFSGQVSWHWTAESLYQLQTVPSQAPSINSNYEVYMDRYSDGWSDLSISFRFRISEQFRFWADAKNLLVTDKVMYDYDRDLYPVDIITQGGITFRAGIRYDL